MVVAFSFICIRSGGLLGSSTNIFQRKWNGSLSFHRQLLLPFFLKPTQHRYAMIHDQIPVFSTYVTCYVIDVIHAKSNKILRHVRLVELLIESVTLHMVNIKSNWLTLPWVVKIYSYFALVAFLKVGIS